MPRYGPYQLLRRLAVGGMAEVFVATGADEVGGAKEGRQVVVKRLLPHLGDRPQFVRMFLDEASLTSRLSHPNVVTIDGFGEADGMHYIAMEFVHGLSLAELLWNLEGERIDRDLGCFILAEACAGLAYAHDKCDGGGESLGIVHRDVSPDNILLSRDGEVKLADFGIAKARSQINRTLPGQVKGKLCYMSPEQATRASDIDHRSDIFSAGVVLYEVTVGERLFVQVNDAALLSHIIHGEHPPPLPIGYPPPLEQVLRRSLSKVPAARYQRAEEMREALLAPLEGQPEGYVERLAQLVSGAMPREGAGDVDRDRRNTEVGTDPQGPRRKGGGQGSLGEPEEVPTEPGIGPLSSLEGDTIKDMPAVIRDELAAATSKLEVADTVRGLDALDGPSTPSPLFPSWSEPADGRPRSESSEDSAAATAPQPVFTGRPGPPGQTDSALITLDDDGPPPISSAEALTRRVRLWHASDLRGRWARYRLVVLAGAALAAALILVALLVLL